LRSVGGTDPNRWHRGIARTTVRLGATLDERQGINGNYASHKPTEPGRRE